MRGHITLPPSPRWNLIREADELKRPVRGLVMMALLAVLTPLVVAAQAPGLRVEDFPGPTPASAGCETGPISYVFIDNHSIFDRREGRFAWAYRLANRLHVRTRKSVIERELLFAPGDCYDPWIIDESERLLRSYPFIAQVDIYGIPQPDGSYHVIVDTRDEWSTQMDLRVSLSSGVGFEGFRLQETNLLGRGQELGVYYIDRDVTRDYGVRFATPQLAGTRWDLSFALGRTRAGTLAAQTIAYPFIGEVSRWALVESFAREDRFFDYVTAFERDDRRLHVLMPLRDKSFDLAIIRRFGRAGNQSLIGGTLGYQEMTYPGTAELATGDDFLDPVTRGDSLLLFEAERKRDELNNIRIGVLLGKRNIHWVRRRGYDSMRGEQDVALGAEVGLVAARSLPAIENDDDIAGTFGLYTGFAAGDLTVVSRARFDGRRDFNTAPDESEWEDVFADAEMLAYFKSDPLSRHTLVFRTAAVAGWNTRTPFQLTLGGDRSLRGYRHDRFPGGRRIVMTLEDRVYFGWPLRNAADIGGTFFADVGRMWAGDAPFGENTGWLASVGAGIRANIPAGSRTTYRIDVAVPVRPGPGINDLRLMISIGEAFGLLNRFGDPQLARSRSDRIASDLFRFR